MFRLKHFFVAFIAFLSSNNFAQNVSLYSQFNGSFDFTFIGNTMNTGENNVTAGCTELLNASSSANLQLSSTQQVERAYLYWAGSGNEDATVTLNGENVTSQRSFSWTSTFGLNYFSSFAEVTTQVLAIGNGTYTLSNLDVSQALNEIPAYCNNRTNFAGWAIIIIYREQGLPINQINVYDGLQGVPNELTITLTNLNVIDSVGSKVGFLAWEGDSTLATETFTLNGNVLSNSLNPEDNIFNSTNAITGEQTPNMDLDIYNIQNNIQIGDTTAQIELTSYQDVVMINAVVTKLNSRLPDATIAIQNIEQQCSSKNIEISYTVYNTLGTQSLPAQIPIAIYVNNVFYAQTYTSQIILYGQSWSGTINVTLPQNSTNNYNIVFVVDDTGTGTGIVIETNENNNSSSTQFSFWEIPNYNVLEPLLVCNEGFTSGTFSFESYAHLVITNNQDVCSGFFESLQDAQNLTNPILNTSNYTAQHTPKEIFVRVDNDTCYAITSFLLTTENCLPTVYNYFSPNDDGANDHFIIQGLDTIFLNFNLNIYNRWGVQVWENSYNENSFKGIANKGVHINQNLPQGTYYYVLDLNDSQYPQPIVGWLYLDR